MWYEKSGTCCCWFWRTRRRVINQGVRVVSRKWIGKEMDSLLEPQESNTAGLIPWFYLFQTSELLNYKETGWFLLTPPHPQLPDGFGREVFKGKFGVKAARCVPFLWLLGGEVMGWCSRNLVLSLKLPSTSEGGGWHFSSCRTQMMLYIFLEEERRICLRMHYCSQLFFPCFYIPSLPWRATVWICPLQLREA